MNWWEWDCMTCGKHIRIERRDEEGVTVATHGEGEARLIIQHAEIPPLDSAWVGKRISTWLYAVHRYERGEGAVATIVGRQ